MGFPIQRSPDQYLFSGSPKLIAASHVFHRHPAPRHPPSALSSLAIIYQMLLFLGTFEIALLYLVFKEHIGLYTLELKAQSSKPNISDRPNYRL
jgi:hypothetical protein